MRNGTLQGLGILACVASGLGAELAQAGPVGPMTNFTAGTTAKASEVNANFGAVKSAVDDNDGRITTNATGVTTNAAGIATNAANISTNIGGIATNAANITDNNTALVAEINTLKAQLAASETCPADTPTRFTDNGDGTVCDSQTGLMWEKKLAADGSGGGNCTDVTLANRSTRCANNLYSWSASANLPNGTLYVDFLAQMNRGESIASDANTITRAGYTDWRVPNIVELRSIIDTSVTGCNAGTACIDPIFGPTQTSWYWSSSATTNPAFAWGSHFFSGLVSSSSASIDGLARAVRGGR